MVTIVNYGMGNLRSIENALAHLRIPCIIEDRPERIAEAEKLILPGVGSFARAMRNLRSSGLRDALEHAVGARQVPMLGICLGMQLLAERGTEDGVSEGLGWIPGEVRRFALPAELKIPHVGFNSVLNQSGGGALFSGLATPSDFYFIHSYHFAPLDDQHVVGTCNYGGSFVAAVHKANVWGVQFHPEKSQGNGLHLLRNFSALVAPTC